MKKYLRIISTVLVIVIGVAIGFYFYMMNGQKEIKAMVINNIDFTKYQDGIYEGKYDGYRWKTDLKVTIKAGKVTNIEIIKDHTFPNPEFKDQLINTVIEKQTLNIDAVSGATISTKAYLKAIQNAFNQ